MKNNVTKVLIAIALMFTAGAAYSEPVRYDFSTTMPLTTDPLLIGLTSVFGSFIYDNAAAPTGTMPSESPFAGSTIYEFQSALSGYADGNHFSHALGTAVVGDDKFIGFSPPTDVFFY